MKKKLLYAALIFSIICLIIFLINFNNSFKENEINHNITTKTTDAPVPTLPPSTTTTIHSSTRTTTTRITTSTKTTTTKKITTTTKDNNVSLKTEDEIKSLKLEEYLIGVLACEIPASYNKEALKAQAIASRTYAVYKMETSNKDYDLVATIDDQCYITESEMKKKWGNTYNKYYKIIKNAVESTEGIIMTKNGNLFKSFYFSTSNGQTRDSQTVFKEGSITSVSSSWDKNSKNYEVATEFKKDALIKLLGDFDTIQIKTRDNANNVTKVCVDEDCYSGIEFRKLINLRSTDFIIDIIDNNYVITTKGYGHGVGMSQYGANYLAGKGYDYKYILNYYYNNVKFEKY